MHKGIAVVLVALLVVVPISGAVQAHEPYPGTAAALSFVVPGLGQVYNGQVLKGMALLGAEAALLGSAVKIMPGCVYPDPSTLEFICGLNVDFNGALLLVAAGLYAWQVFDAYDVALKAVGDGAGVSYTYRF